MNGFDDFDTQIQADEFFWDDFDGMYDPDDLISYDDTANGYTLEDAYRDITEQDLDDDEQSLINDFISRNGYSYDGME